MAKEEKKPVKLKKTSKKWKLYEKSADGIKRKNRNCPKCGPGVFMAQHKDRVTCGQCGYTEFQSKKK